jgi:hypothetical protein
MEIRPILQRCGCKEELSTLLKPELFTLPRQGSFAAIASPAKLVA